MVFSFSNGVYGLLYKNTVKTKLMNQSRINSFIKKAHNRYEKKKHLPAQKTKSKNDQGSQLSYIAVTVILR